MSRAKFNFWVDILFLIALLVVILTGMLLWGWLRPAGMGGPGGPGVASGAQAKVARAEASQTPPTPNESSQQEAPNAEANQSDSARSEASRVESKRESVATNAPGGPQMGEARIFWGLLHGKTFLGLTKKGWANGHAWTSVAMIVFFILHLWTHFKTLVALARNDRARVEAPARE